MKTIRQKYGVDIEVHLSKNVVIIKQGIDDIVVHGDSIPSLIEAIAPGYTGSGALSDKLFKLANELAVAGHGEYAVKLHQISNDLTNPPQKH